MSTSARYMLGVDLGTTSTKTVVFTLDGKVVAQHAEEGFVRRERAGMMDRIA